MSIGGCTLEDAVKIRQLSTQVAFGVVGNSIFYDPFTPSKVLFSTENVVKAFFDNKKYIPDDWSDFARMVTQSFSKFVTDLPPTYIVLGGPPPDYFLFHIVFWYLKPDGRLGTYTFSLQYVREIGRLHPFRMEAPAETFETARASAWGNVRLFDELTNGGDSRFDELRNAPELKRLLVENPPASEVSVEEDLTAANIIIIVSRTMTSTLKPIKEASDIEEKTDCAIISRQTGFKWLSEESEIPAIPKLARRIKKRRR